MLRRISEIKNVGRFKSHKSGRAQFDKITFVYGRNTYGKSTLGDLLSSLQTNDISRIKGRKTIPRSGEAQLATFKFKIGNTSDEISSKFENTTWNPGLPDGIGLKVFDEGFYHNNVFAARKFNRSTKENFSAFVLGEKGVAQAQLIAKKKKLKGDATRERNKLKSAAFSGIKDLAAFLKLKPNETEDNLNQTLADLRSEQVELNKQVENAHKIQIRSELIPIRWESQFTKQKADLDSVLFRSIETHHEEARKVLEEHTANHFRDPQGAERWIREGLDQNKGEICQFCGQKLQIDAMRLIEIYRQSFDEEYQKHEREMVADIDTILREITSDIINQERLKISNNNTILASYPEIEPEKSFAIKLNDLGQLSNKIQALFKEWDENLAVFTQALNIIVEKKKDSPHLAFQPLEATAILDLNSTILKLVTEYGDIVASINQDLLEFRNSVEDKTLEQRISKVKINIAETTTKLERIKLDKQCEDYIKLTEKIDALSADIPRLSEELRNDQSQYLDQFYDRLNKYFKIFGSDNFLLEKGEDDSGHNPIYYLIVKYQGQDVSERDLDCVFSESDRRALALAVFWAGLVGINEAMLENTIVVLDDPVSSFDSNRATLFNQEIVRLSDMVRQIIVLCHFENGICRFFNTYGDTKPVVLLEIERQQDTSIVSMCDIDQFLRNDHEKQREIILRFISGETNAISPGDMRVFLEYEINQRFAKQIRDTRINERQFSDQIEKLVEYNIIDRVVGNELNKWRETLNSAHHIWEGSDIEDQRSTAAQFMEFVYRKLLPI